MKPRIVLVLLTPVSLRPNKTYKKSVNICLMDNSVCKMK